MTPERWERIKKVFGASLERAGPERSAFIEQACAGDGELKTEVQRLLAAHEHPGAFLETGKAPAPASGQRIGAYQVIRELGHGGMGEVYLAERADGAYRKQVAIKVARRELVAPDLLARFRHERQVLAELVHPNIATLLDGGTTEDGLPYFVMEHVEGEPIDRYCERMQLPVEARLDLFEKVCGAVGFAHAKLVIHRDIKPANILVTADGVPKLLDFGLAKVLAPGASDETAPQLRYATPGCASPEQLRGDKVTAASDVYSLGVLLRVLVPGKLDKVVAKATAQEPAQRYRSVDELAAAARSRLSGAPTFFSELKRRRVVRALIAYGIAAFAVLQIVEPIMHGAHWPDVVLSYVVAALAAGFPVVVALAWIFDVNAGRIERTPGSAAMNGARLALVLGGIGLLAAAPGLTWYFLLRPRQPPAMASASERSIAVLPFTSLSAGEENKYFADAIHIELLGQLAKIGDLKVISRTSVLQYKEGARNLREIGEALGVSSVLEGSVQYAGNRVRIQAQLIDATRDRQIWADRYDRELTDLFLIQTAVAEEIAKALHARLLPEERNRIARQPTANAEAYALYLRAWEMFNRLGWVNDSSVAEQLFTRALDLDPAFALAHARFSVLHSKSYWFNRDHTQARIARAREEADRALALQPDLAEAHLALGIYHYWGRRDYDRALPELEIARLGVPGVVEYIAYVQRRQGRFEDARRNLAQAVSLDPRSAPVQIELVNTLLPMRKYEEAAAAIERLALLDPNSAKTAKAFLAMLWKGDIELGKAVLQGLARASASTWIETWMPQPALAKVLDVVPEDTLAALPAAPPVLAGSDWYRPKPLLFALMREAAGEVAQARPDYEAARVDLEAAVAKDPEDALRRVALARAYAGLGRKKDALREARGALELVPLSKDAMSGPVMLEELAAVEARTGEAEAAIDRLEKLLAIPSSTSAALFRIDPKWKPLRNSPRFQKLVGIPPG